MVAALFFSLFFFKSQCQSRKLLTEQKHKDNSSGVLSWVEKGLELEIGFSDNSAKFGQSTLQNLSYLALILVILYMHISNLGAQFYISNTCPSHTTTSLIHVWPWLVQVHITHVGATCALKEKSDTKSMCMFTQLKVYGTCQYFENKLHA